jgi:hypothetical protein
MLVDPAIQMCASSVDGTKFYAYEVCDAVEDRSYVIQGHGIPVHVSDFVFPAWFEGFHKPKTQQFSLMSSVNAPFALTAGGYISVYENGNWTQLTGSDQKAASLAAQNHKTRMPKRAVKFADRWRLSTVGVPQDHAETAE